MNRSYKAVFNPRLGLLQAVSELAKTRGKSGAVSAAGLGAVVWFGLGALMASPASAQCTDATAAINTTPASDTAITCTGASTTPVNAAAGSSNVTITVNAGASISASHTAPGTIALLSIAGSSAITNTGDLTLSGDGATAARGVAMLGAASDGISNSLFNNGTITTTGAYNFGMAASGGGTVGGGGSGNLLVNNGTIKTLGTASYGMASGFTFGGSIGGVGVNTLTNNGRVETEGANARVVSVVGSNTVVNNNPNGILRAQGTNSVGVYLNGATDELYNAGTIEVNGASSMGVNANLLNMGNTATITNVGPSSQIPTGGKIISASGPAINVSTGIATIINGGLLQGGAGTAIQGNASSSLNVRLQITSSIVGSVAGGTTGGNDLTLLQQPGPPGAIANGAVSNAFTNFQTLTVQGSNWEWSGTGDFTTVAVNGGTLVLSGSGTLGATDNVRVGGGAALVIAAQTAGALNTSVVQLDINANLSFNPPNTNYSFFAPLITGAGTVNILAGLTQLTAANTYTGGTRIEGGTLLIASDLNLGADSGALSFDGGTLHIINSSIASMNRPITLNAGGGTFEIDPLTATGLSGQITGTGRLIKNGSGTLALGNITNDYSGGTLLNDGELRTVNNNVLSRGALTVDGGTLNLFGTDQIVGSLAGSGGAIANNVGVGGTSSTLTVQQASDGEYAGAISNGTTGNVLSLDKTGAAMLTLSGTSDYSGSTGIFGGELRITGSLTSDNNNVAVNAGGTLSGTGSIAGAVAVNAGGTLKGMAGAAPLTMGSLVLSEDASVDLTLGAPSEAELFDVIGNLTLDGTLAITDAGGFTQGLYRLFNYGSLTDRGLSVGPPPAGYTGGILSVQTGVTGNHVNLLAMEPPPVPPPSPTPAPPSPPPSRPSRLTDAINFWNGQETTPTGTVIGGSGTWNAEGSNWTNPDATVNGAYNPDAFLIFSGSSGEVTVDAGDDDALAVNGGMQFAVSYIVQGDGLRLGGATNVIRVGDGTAFGVNYNALIRSNLSGTGGLELNDPGKLILDGTNTYSGGTVIQSGTLQLGDGGSTGSILGDVHNNGTLAFFRNDALNFSGAISGTGAVQQNGTGVLTLSGANTYSGGTLIAFGSVIGSSGSFGTGPIQNDFSLVLDQSSDATFGNVLDGDGAFIKRGAAKLELTGQSALGGPTSVEAGTLAVNGALANSTVTAMNGARVGGTGTLGGLVLQTGATAAPGNSIGTLNVAGNVSFEANSTFEVEANAAGQADRITATGAAVLDGKVAVLAGAGNYALDTRYTILSAAGGRSGQFTSVSSSLAFLDPTLSYDTTSVYLNLTRNDIGFGEIGGTFNQMAAGSGVESLGRGNALWDAAVQLDAASARAAFDQVSGEIHASTKTALLEDSRFVREAALARLSGAEADSVVWGRLFGSWAQTDSDGNAAQLDRDTSGVLVGADGQFARNARLGILGGFSRTRMEAAARGSASESSNAHIGAYVGNANGKLALRAGAALTWHGIETARALGFLNVADNLQGDYDATTTQIFGEMGYRFVALEPFVNLAHVSVDTDEMNEDGGVARLEGGDGGTRTSFATVGVHTSAEFAIGSGNAMLKGTLGWRHAFGDVLPLSTLSFASGKAFTVAGAPVAENAAVIDVGVDFAAADNATFGFSYNGQFGSGVGDNGVRVDFSLKF
jgi:outer membrane autotransporter protein